MEGEKKFTAKVFREEEIHHLEHRVHREIYFFLGELGVLGGEFLLLFNLPCKKKAQPR